MREEWYDYVAQDFHYSSLKIDSNWVVLWRTNVSHLGCNICQSWPTAYVRGEKMGREPACHKIPIYLDSLISLLSRSK